VTKQGVKSFSTQNNTPTNNEGVTIGKARHNVANGGHCDLKIRLLCMYYTTIACKASFKNL